MTSQTTEYNSDPGTAAQGKNSILVYISERTSHRLQRYLVGKFPELGKRLSSTLTLEYNLVS